LRGLEGWGVWQAAGGGVSGTRSAAALYSRCRPFPRSQPLQKRARDNEARSAEAARAALASAGAPPAMAARAAAHVLATAGHLHGPDRDGHVVVDADLAVLGSPPPRYAAYALAVRREWGHLDDAAFCAGR
jgi:predicted metal-dependent HD superfamily phosphohydrolase